MRLLLVSVPPAHRCAAIELSEIGRDARRVGQQPRHRPAGIVVERAGIGEACRHRSPGA